MTTKRLTILEIAARKGQTPLVCLTAYTHPFAQILDPYADVLLVGDSLGMVLYGMDSTLDVNVSMMCEHGAAVVRGSSHALVVVDMPFGSYQPSKATAFRNAARIMKKSGCQAVKIEGGVETAETIEHLTSQGIPVMGHIGLQPQSVHALGGYKYQGRTSEDEKRLIKDAKTLEKAGVFAIVLESVAKHAAEHIVKAVNVPIIGIGASEKCDGQILVTEDMAGLITNPPKFVEQFGSMAEGLRDAAAQYASAVKERQFPKKEHCFGEKKS
jgi:3-methyl-2-oxobutanoate hydroxymethyltransferase